MKSKANPRQSAHEEWECMAERRKGMSGWLSQLDVGTPDFVSGHDLRVVRSSPQSGSILGMESA